ncbi:MAG: DEAD/DEAH box helicase [Coriobacteriales bacterium]|nr:DEAD/DEAH box helicase [Coriobacteriales bacterium]
MPFASLGLSPKLIDAIETLGFEEPTPIQREAIPLVLAGRDVVGAAQTGTGKTAAFTLPMLDRIAPGSGSVKALVVSPTRELAQQIERVAAEVAEHTGHKVVVVVGGEKYGPQVSKLRGGADILIATPGRLLDLKERGDADLSGVEVLVLDEADRMLDMGFWPAVRRILRSLPANRQNLLFSATMSDDVLSVVRSALHDPAFIEIAPKGTTGEQIEQAIMPVSHSQKFDLLAALIRDRGADRVLVFTRTKNRADLVMTVLEKEGFRIDVMHADRSQKQRTRALEDFRAGKVDVLVATDIVARGIDISDIDHVVNFDVPLNPDDYIHRVGRTARAGQSGYALTFIAPDEITPLREIEYLLEKALRIYDLPGFPYREDRIVPFEGRPTKRAARSAFGGGVMRRGRRR